MSKKINYGKRFEEDFLKSTPAGVFKLRIKDDTLRFKNVNNPADVILFFRGKMFLLELKSTKEKSLPYGNIQDNQLNGLYESSRIEGIIAGLVINFRSVEETYFLHIDKALEYMQTTTRKSFSLDFIRQEGILIECKKKRVRYNYNINNLIDYYIK